ncbi:MAG: hypothetical protein NXI31_26560 [bacterium]|nr:hypothetical protein [bacterium]
MSRSPIPAGSALLMPFGLACVGVLPSACSFAGVSTVPLSGPAPRSVALWPGLHSEYAAVGPMLFTGLGQALRSRGYRTTSVAVSRQLLLDSGADELAPVPTDLSAAGVALEADAVLVLEVHDFEAAGDGSLSSARWDLGWRLLSTRGHGVLWQHSHGGAWRRSSEGAFDSLERLDLDNTVIPVGGDPGWSFRSVGDLAANLHRLALMHLPRAAARSSSQGDGR